MMSSRRAAILLVALSVCIFAADAESRGRRFDVGVHFGPDIADIYGVDADSLGSDTRTAFAAGVWGTNWLSDNVGVRLEVMYAQKGAERGSGDEKAQAKLDYIDIPLLVVFMRELTPQTFFVNMHVGPAIGLQISAESDSSGVTRDLESITSKWDFSGVLGVGFSYRAAERLDVTLDLRYTLGFVSVDDTPDDFDWRNSYFAVLLGVQSRLGYW